MSNIYKNIEFQKRLKSLDENNILHILDKQKKIKRYSSNTTPLIKQKINYDSSENIRDSNKPININDSKHSLFLKKINLKENKNKYYIEGVYQLFNDENMFLDSIYKGKKIVIGKSRNKKSIILNIRNNQKINTKKLNYIKPKNKNLSSSNITNNKSYTFQMNNNTANDSNMQSTKGGRKIIWAGAKKNDNYISDDELKNIYQDCINRENACFKEYTEKSKNKSFINNSNKSPSIKEVNNILNLQSLVLNKYKIRKMETKKMIDRLLRQTTKNKDTLLINQLNDYRLKKEKIDEEETNHIIIDNPNFKNTNIKEVEQKIQWLSSLRDYQNDINIKDNKKRCISSNNKDLNSLQHYCYSFDKRDILFDLSGKLYPLFAQIIPKVYKENEKIRDTLHDMKTHKNNSIYNNTFSKFNNIIFNNKNKSNLYKGLNIRGKKLLNFEIELSKELEGKKKKLVQFPYRDDEITTKLFAKSYSVNNFFVPKSVKNTFELHNIQE